MNIVIGGFSHETNTFNPRRTTLERIMRDGVYLHGDEVVKYFSKTRTAMGGIIAGGRELGLRVTPTFFAYHGPSTGLIDREVVEHCTQELVNGVRLAQPDGVLLHLHGAAAADGISDPEAFILAAVRNVVGVKVPLIVVYDMHANIGPSWAMMADAIIGFKTAPHTDMFECGFAGVALMKRTLANEVKPLVRLSKPPILIKSGLMSMTDAPLALIKPPMFWLVSRAREFMKLPNVLDVSVAAGFGDADVPEAGMTILATTNGDAVLAERIVSELSALAISLRRGFETDLVLTPVELAVSRAIDAPHWPVILADQGNNTAGGSPGDGTAILVALKNAGWPDAALFICDADAAKEACIGGVGSQFFGSIGAKLDTSSGKAVHIDGIVRLLFDGKMRDDHFDIPLQLGATAVVRCGQTDIILTERPCTTQIHPNVFRQVGIEPTQRRILVLQSAHLFRDEFDVKHHIPRMIIDVDSPGVTNPNARRFAYQFVKRPIFPLDEI